MIYMIYIVICPRCGKLIMDQLENNNEASERGVRTFFLDFLRIQTSS